MTRKQQELFDLGAVWVPNRNRPKPLMVEGGAWWVCESLVKRFLEDGVKPSTGARVSKRQMFLGFGHWAWENHGSEILPHNLKARAAFEGFLGHLGVEEEEKCWIGLEVKP